MGKYVKNVTLLPIEQACGGRIYIFKPGEVKEVDAGITSHLIFKQGKKLVAFDRPPDNWHSAEEKDISKADLDRLLKRFGLKAVPILPDAAVENARATSQAVSEDPDPAWGEVRLRGFCKQYGVEVPPRYTPKKELYKLALRAQDKRDAKQAAEKAAAREIQAAQLRAARVTAEALNMPPPTEAEVLGPQAAPAA